MAKKKARKAAPKRTAKPAPVEAAVPAELVAPTTSPDPLPAELPQEPVKETPAEAAAIRHHRAGMVGIWAYVAGLVIAAGAAVFVQQGLDLFTYGVLAILGVVVGLLNITDEEILLFLVATVALVISANSVRAVLENIAFVEAFLKNVIIFTAASAFIVSLKALFKVARSE